MGKHFLVFQTFESQSVFWILEYTTEEKKTHLKSWINFKYTGKYRKCKCQILYSPPEIGKPDDYIDFWITIIKYDLVLFSIFQYFWKVF